MKFGVFSGNFGTFGGKPGADGCLVVAEEAERLGFDSVWVHDHVIMPSGVRSKYPYSETGASPFRVDQYIYDPLALMAAIAARTQRIAIGTSVLIVPYRDPIVTAKALATIDCISHGRIILGIGVGWMQEEFEALGIGELFEKRGAVTDEFVAVYRDLWTQTAPSSFSGRRIRYREVGANPLPWQKPHIPIWVGGKTPAALRRVARYGSGYHTITSTPDQIAAEVRAVRAELGRAGRDPDEITVSMLWAGLPVRGVAQTIDAIGEYARAGMHHLVGIPWLLARDPESLSGVDVLEATLENMRVFAAEVLPRAR